MVRLSQGLSIVEVEGGKIILDTKRGVYWHLNETAMTVVEELDRGQALDDLISQVVRETGADEERVRSDYLSLVDELRRAKLIKGKPA
ncbi:PqqD family peptide modification chaperone [Microbispora hainanensis]|uniref:PqqD family peptide modification chaperone n=1 Tax=Microbispora hainanensis TaxID=568844 RepID=UPI0033C84BD7